MQSQRLRQTFFGLRQSQLSPMLADSGPPKVVVTLWLCFLLGFSSLASAQSTCYQNKQKPLCDRNVQLSPGVEQEVAYGPGSPHLASAEANLPSSPRALEALECSSNSRYSILL